jgi:L-lactate dehydrogenase complex protein LldG
MERSEFLARVETAQAAAILPDHPSEDPGQWVPDLPEVDLVERFVEMAEKMAAEVHTGAVDDVIAEVIERYAIDNYMSWDVDRIDGLDRLPDGLHRIVTETPRGPEGRAAHNAGYMDCRLGITGAEAAFAETGTIVVRSGPGRPRMASLVPLVHVAVLRTDRIFRSASHWAADPSARMSEGSNVVFITGPSKTADIESIVTLGVHGPKHLHIVLV